ncbi:MAG: N-acetylglucosamine-6-phosphate deacetylase [Anaerolineae bacterium]|nr:N-acetylglucosamine-6-phosphate deacetylase [Anaerolineae bacterium]
MTLVIHNATVLTPDRRLEHAAVRIEDERIAWMGAADEAAFPPEAQVYDATGLILAPGFIDLQINGAFGDDFTADPASIWRVAEQLPRYGVTSFLPTIVTSPLDTIVRAQRTLMAGRPADFRGAEPLGLHVEGPFLNPHKKGAHNPAYLRPPDPALVADWSPATGIRLVTLAPELPGGLPMVRHLTAHGVVVSAGHSLATYTQAQEAFAAGLRYGTHLFNAMPPLLHREPGLAGALLAAPGIVVGLIADGIHVHPGLIRIIWAVKGAAGVTLVSDAMAALGMAPGRYRLNDLEVIVSERDARLADGTLAGSVLSLDQAVRNLMAFTGCGLAEALTAVTAAPAALLGMAAVRGRIAAGMIADLVLLDADLRVAATVVRGHLIPGE